MTDITNLQQNKYLQCGSHGLFNPVEVSSKVNNGPSFLSMTAFDIPSIKGIEYDEAVLNGTVANEIKAVVHETKIINSVVSNNVLASQFDSENVFTSKSLNATASTGEVPVSNTKNLKEKTDTTKLLTNICYSDNYNKDVQKKVIESGIKTLVDWLDDYINNYEDRVAEGKNRGDSEVKLSFLLRLRNAIENCDFPVGFGNDDYFKQASSGNSVVLGAYSAAYATSSYLNPNDHSNENVGALNHFNRSIILNAGVFCIDRKYTSEAQLVAAINSAASGENPDATFTYADILMSSDDFYYNYASAYFASILAHEFIHSTHITNEAVTYNTCEMIEDDFRYKPVFGGWAQETQNAVNRLTTDFDLNSYTYGVAFLPIGTNGAGLGFHDLSSIDSVASHGHDENMSYDDILFSDGTIAYKGYKNFTTGNSLYDDKKELMNFIV